MRKSQTPESDARTVSRARTYAGLRTTDQMREQLAKDGWKGAADMAPEVVRGMVLGTLQGIVNELTRDEA